MPKNKKAAEVEEDEDDEDETTDEADDSEDDDTEESDEEEAEDEDEDEDADEDSDSDDDDDDEDEKPAPKKAKKAASSGRISWDTDDAEAGGLPEGRVELVKPHTRLASTANYEEDDTDSGVPVLSIKCYPVDKKNARVGDPFNIHLSAGKAARLIPTDDGSDFQPADDSPAKGLSKTSNCYYFVKSIEDAGFPKDKLRSQGIAVIAHSIVELTRVPQPARRGLAAADEGETANIRTMPSVTEIYVLPWERKKKAKPAAEEPVKKGKPGRPKGSKNSPKAEGRSVKPVVSRPKPAPGDSTDVTRAAEIAIQKTLQSPRFRTKGLPLNDAYPEAFPHVKSHPKRKHIMALIADVDWLKDDARLNWHFDQGRECLVYIGQDV